jgi:hypothetical protein
MDRMDFECEEFKVSTMLGFDFVYTSFVLEIEKEDWKKVR